jgi:hypothetical protein
MKLEKKINEKKILKNKAPTKSSEAVKIHEKDHANKII